MINLKDKAIRHQLIERYLDADTSVEEERAMADFYRHCDESELTNEDLDIRTMMLGLNIAAQKETTAKDYQTTARAYQKEKQPKHATAKIQKPEKPNPQNKWVRFSAIMLAAAMLAGLIFLVFPIKDRMAQKPNFAALAPTSQVIRSQQAQDNNDDLSPAEQMERQDSLFLAATKDIVTPREAKRVSAHKSHALQPKRIRNTLRDTCNLLCNNKKDDSVIAMQQNMKVEHSESSYNSRAATDIHQLYEVASLALPSADQLKIDKQGNHIVISTIDENGNSQHYTVDVDDAQDGIYQLHPLAQLNN